MQAFNIGNTKTAEGEIDPQNQGVRQITFPSMTRLGVLSQWTNNPIIFFFPGKTSQTLTTFLRSKLTRSSDESGAAMNESKRRFLIRVTCLIFN
jgi:hypothetical protein